MHHYNDDDLSLNKTGCPLSPLSFPLAIEPLAIALRSNPTIAGIQQYGLEAKVSLYEDDLLFYVSYLQTSVPIVLRLLSDVGQLSGYKLNLGKIELFPVSLAAKSLPL